MFWKRKRICKRFILTGAPGAGKTSIIRALGMRGESVVDEAATDVIAHEQAQGHLNPWNNSAFIDAIVELQKHRQLNTQARFYDRSPVCTYALALYLGFEPSPTLMHEIARIHVNKIYERRVFFVENLGFITNTDAGKISFEDALRFEQMHLDAYRKFDYECVMIPKAPIEERVEIILKEMVGFVG